MWKIYKINYIYPSVNSGEVNSSLYGSMNIENIFIENEDYAVEITFEDNKVQAFKGKKENRKIVWDDTTSHNIKDMNIDMSNSNISNVVFFGMENDDDGNNTTEENFDLITNGEYGKYVKINVKDVRLDSDYINDTIKEKILEKAIEVIKKYNTPRNHINLFCFYDLYVWNYIYC